MTNSNYSVIIYASNANYKKERNTIHEKNFLILNAISLIILLLNVALNIVFYAHMESSWGIVMPLLSLFLLAGLFIAALLLKNARDCVNISPVLHIGIALTIFNDYVYTLFVQYYYTSLLSDDNPVFIILSSILSALCLILCGVFMYFYVTDLNSEKSAATAPIAQNSAANAASRQPAARSTGTATAYEELNRSKKLCDDGIISQEIYDIKKAKYLEML